MGSNWIIPCRNGSELGQAQALRQDILLHQVAPSQFVFDPGVRLRKLPIDFKMAARTLRIGMDLFLP